MIFPSLARQFEYCNEILQDYHEDLAADNQIRASNLIARTKNHVVILQLHKHNY